MNIQENDAGLRKGSNIQEYDVGFWYGGPERSELADFSSHFQDLRILLFPFVDESIGSQGLKAGNAKV